METQSKNIASTEALSKFRFVAADGTHTVTTKAVGATAFAVTSGDDIAWQDDDKPWVIEAGGTITAGDRVTSDANGKATSLTPTTVAHVLTICGVALDAAVSGGFLRVDHLHCG